MECDFLKELNQSQRQAVEYIDGPSLVIAGAGSGKTRVLTYKIAYLLSQGMKPWNILALTFTNKAAREMKDRIAGLVGADEAQQLWMGTFHSIFNRILRREASSFGFQPNYTIYQSSDSRSLVKSIVKEMGLDEKIYKPSSICARISEAKNALVTPKAYCSDAEVLKRDTYANVPAARDIYSRYFDRCHQANAMDFDDLLLYTYFLFQRCPEVCQRYSSRFQYILVDEYQDTNYAQHQIMRQLSEVHQKICVVGDDAQSIYSFRGAKIDNILKFTQTYQDAKLFKLERNYRSTQNIVGAANSLIACNKEQIPKDVYSKNEMGQPLMLSRAYSDVEEGEIVCSRVVKLHGPSHVPYGEMAILYRTNAQSRIFEEALRKRAVPYRIYGGHSFYDQKEIRDVLAYFRLIANPDDEEAFKRIINYPARGIGNVTLGKIIAAAVDNNTGVWSVMSNPDAYRLSVSPATRQKLRDFYEMMNGLISDTAHEDAYQIGQRVIKESGILAEAYRDSGVESKEMQDNLSELLNGMSTFVDMQKENGDEDAVFLNDYLSDVSLLSDTDDRNDDNQDKVTLMTVHAAKGLEFEAVFIVGMEENLFPNQMATYSPRELEEERRLFYVAITRAKHYCFLSCSQMRFHYGTMDFSDPSRFLKEIDTRYLLLDDIKKERKDLFESMSSGAERISPPVEREEKRPRLRPLVSNRDVVTEGQELESVTIGGKILKAGMSVEHERFGHGEVLKLEGEKENAKATVRFENMGEKHLLLKYAKLKVLDD